MHQYHAKKTIIMKNNLLTLLLALISFVSFGQQWKTTVNASSESTINISVDVPEFNTNQVTTPRGEALVVSIPKAMRISVAGEPELPLIAIPVVIGDNALMGVEVTGAQYTDYENMEIAPSKGEFPRSINPDDVPYTYGAVYQQDAFFPSAIAKLDEPYIHRDVRGQNIMLTPITYNPMTKVLRVYHHVELSMVKLGIDSRNVITNRAKSFLLDPEFKAIYENRYINYSQSMAKYTPITDNGELLIICHDQFMTAMEPFVTWKRQTGRPTTMVGTSVTGNTATAIKSYIQAYYAEHPELTDILLVGDVAQIPGVYIEAGTGVNDNYSGYGDLQYGQLAGNDYYNEVIVGRFCCDNIEQVTHHVHKVLNYERDLDETATWLSVGQGVSTNSQAGHYGESDYQHVDNLRTDLLGYNYTDVYRDYAGVTGSTANNAAAVSQHINDGVSIINYCNHGSETSWGVFSYSNSNVNALTNDYKLPYIISVACLNGKYDRSGDCFAEAWMRATNNSTGNPTGAIGGMFSYISQPWFPPMYGQDEMIDILVESYANNIRRTMGGVSINGNMKVLDQGASLNENKGTYNNWILYGDPTLTLRNTVPAVMDVTATTPVNIASTELNLIATNADGALATLTLDNEIMGSATINNGTANITFEATGRTGIATLTVFGYNKKTFITTVDITDGTTSPLMVIASADPETITLGESLTLTANASGGTGNYSYSWSPQQTITAPNNATTIATPTEIGSIVYLVTVNDGENTASADVTVTVNEPQPVDCPQAKHFEGESYYDSGEFGARLSWDKAEYEYTLDRFEIYRSDDGQNYTLAQRIVNTPFLNHYQCDDRVDLPGLYFYKIIAFYQNDCQSEPAQIEVVVLDYTAVNELSANQVAIYPNPTSGQVTVVSEKLQQISIVNSLGQTLSQFQAEGDKVSIELSTFGRGIYMLMIRTENGISAKRVVVE